jgi:hypothetical protein
VARLEAGAIDPKEARLRTLRSLAGALGVETTRLVALAEEEADD